MQNLIMGVVPCKDRFFLDKALALVKPGIEEIVAFSDGEDTYYNIVMGLYSGTKQLELIYTDEEGIDVDKQQAVVISMLLGHNKEEADIKKNYAGFAILELMPTSLHVYQLYIAPEHRGLDKLGKVHDIIVGQAKLLGAPYISFVTNELAGAKHFGFKETYTMFRKKL